jgi:hypothetical protein
MGARAAWQRIVLVTNPYFLAIALGVMKVHSFSATIAARNDVVMRAMGPRRTANTVVGRKRDNYRRKDLLNWPIAFVVNSAAAAMAIVNVFIRLFMFSGC